MVDYGLAGKVAIVTGAASGIGKWTAKKFADEGAKVYLIDRDSKVQGVADRINELAGKGVAYSRICDVTNEAQVQEVYQSIAKYHNGIGIHVANAGIAHTKPIEQTTLEEYQKVMVVNAISPWITTKAWAELAKESGGRGIIMCSAIAFESLADRSAYGESKGATVPMVRSFALEKAYRNCQFNGVAPGRVWTEFVYNYLDKLFPEWRNNQAQKEARRAAVWNLGQSNGGIRGLAMPTEIADLILYLASNKSSAMNGEIVTIGGFVGMRPSPEPLTKEFQVPDVQDF